MAEFSTSRDCAPDGEPGFVGREREVASFQRAFEKMLTGRRRILTLAGEPGIGKTRLAQAFAGAAEDQGALVLWGHCYEEAGAPPFWPWVQIIRDFVAATSPSELGRIVGPDVSAIVTLVPEVGIALGETPAAAPAQVDSGETRFRTFDGISRFLQRATSQVPLVLIIDNAHWADKTSLALLEFLRESLATSRLLVVCAYRDTEISRYNPLASTLGELSRSGDVDRIRLTGLDSASIATLARNLLGGNVPDDVIAEIDQQTDGNPLFVIELLKELIEQSRDAGVDPIRVRIPDGVRETIGRRLSRLPDSVNDLLRIASVLGQRFDNETLVAVARIDITTALSSLDVAVRAGFVSAEDDNGRTYRFTHALIRETLYDEIPTSDRLRLHGETGEALVARGAGHEPSVLARIAHHFLESAALGRTGRATEFALLAGDAAMLVDAYEDAAIHYDNAIRVLGPHANGGSEQLKSAIFGRSRALLGTGDVDGAATLLAASIGGDGFADDLEWVADVLTQCVCLRSDRAQGERLPVLGRVLESLPAGDSSARAKTLAALALSQHTLGNPAPIPQLIDESLAIARRLGDPAVLSECLRSSNYALRGDPSAIGRRLAISAEFLRVAPAGDNCQRQAEAHYQHALDLIDAGRIDEVAQLLDDYRNLKVTKLGLHEYRVNTLSVAVALLRGEYTGLETRIAELQEIGQKTRRDDADGVYGAQMFMLNRDLGRLAPLAPAIEQFAASPTNRAWAPGLMLALVEIGSLDHARCALEKLAAGGFSAIPQDEMRVTALVYCSETACALDDSARAHELYDLLLPHAGTFANHPTAICLGSTDHYLGMLADTFGNADLAKHHFDNAIRANTRARAWPWLARTFFRMALLLRRSNADEDLQRSTELLREAEQLAVDLGMSGLSTAIGRASRGREEQPSYPDELTDREVDVLRLLAIGRSNKDIAKVLSISLNTVATHVRHILTKTACANRTEAAAYASRHKLTG